MDQLIIVVLAPIFFAISFIYSSVGFAGGSSYIAVLVLAGVSLYAVPPISLALNIVAASMAFFNYARARYFSLRFSFPFLSSLPFVFYSGLLVLPEKRLALVFVIALFAASAALFASSSNGCIGISRSGTMACSSWGMLLGSERSAMINFAR